MIIYGTNGAHVRTAPLPGIACPGCAATDKMQLSVFSRYAHIYWVPLFPYSKPAVLQCNHCQQGWEGKSLPTEFHEPARALKKETRAPIWHWSGLGIVAALIGWGAFASSQDARANAAYLAAPRVGDIYTVRENEGERNYSLLKVVAVKVPTVDVVPNEYVIDNSHPLEELNAPAKYSKESFTLNKLELTIMQNKGQLTDVDRLTED
ncbi:hypothetical protein [Hymenobacter sp. IS2118]|uniref:hypothetical protein n=1 Tax=Hymenobacter sp. IS2118 TaxID=1505605 RepID=UPI0005580A29|nr:hypothetical protein [Hymenobacter sp. IS2118]